jgi:RNA polymerase sigma-70 factor (ECF subfamily)
MTSPPPPATQRGVSDEDLLARIAGGDSTALEALYERYARVVYGLALRMLGNRELAEDLVQETFWRVWRRSSTFNHERGRVASWVLGIAHNLAIDELRRQRLRPTPVYEDDARPALLELEDEQADVAGAALDSEQRRVLKRALQAIPPEQREVIELAYFGGLSQREIAERLQNPVGTVKTRVRLALQKLRDVLHAQGLHPDDLGS